MVRPLRYPLDLEVAVLTSHWNKTDIAPSAPIHKFWDSSTTGYCLRPVQNLMISGAINTTFDFLVVFLVSLPPNLYDCEQLWI